MSNIIHKVKDALHHDKAHEQPEGTHGPHSSRVANAADPRVDSDRDHRANPATSHGTSGLTGTTHGTHTTTGMTGTHGSTNAGPHNSNLMNKADPRVDSDRDHRGAAGSGLTGTHDTSGGMTGTTTGAYSGSTNAGPHNSNLMNKADPRVDSDRDHRAAPGGGLTGTHGTHGTTGLTGGTHHNVTSGLHSGPGPAPNTAGPHKSDMMNKVDPRVDSDLDGSKTVGQDKTYQRSTVAKDPTDAAQVPPSVMRKHIGDPVIEHDDYGHNRLRRNSRATEQETFRGI